MKTRIVLSAAAVLFAVAGALTTNAAKTNLISKVPVTLPGAPNCEQTGVCDSQISGACMVNDIDQYRLRQPDGSSGFTCSVLATGKWSEE